ncbi:MAG: adenylyl-sulfate kinase [Nocardioides sp.]
MTTHPQTPGKPSGPAVPQHCPTPRELDDLELLVSGALAPVSGFNEPGSPITLTLPPELIGEPEVELVDPEGFPVARVTPHTLSDASAGIRDASAVRGGWAVTSVASAQYGPFRRLHLTPAEVRAQHAGRTFVPVIDALSIDQLASLASLGPVALLALTGVGTPALSAVALMRASLAAAERLPDAVVIAVPWANHADGDAELDRTWVRRVVSNYAGPDPIRALDDDLDLTGEREYWGEIAEIVDFDQPPPGKRGVVLLFTGLSGSGKSTVAQAVMDTLLEQGHRTITSLDGDVVRRNLSAGLTFSTTDRETNIRRIGWVAAEISRHGGVAVCSPIAPFDSTRQQVRAMVEAAGGEFVLIHIATPLAECERRDRKGLYAKARRGEIADFTGISSPYEEPAGPALRIDTTGRTVADCRDEVVAFLRQIHLIH